MTPKKPAKKAVRVAPLTLAQVGPLIAGQRRDFDHLAEVLGLRDQLDDDRNRANMRTAGQLRTVDRALASTQDALAGLLDRLAFYERTVPSLAAARKRFDAALKQETKRRKAAVAKHPEWTERERGAYLRSGRLPEPETPPAEVSGAPVSPDTLEQMRTRHLAGMRTPSPSEREAAAERAVRGDAPA